MALITGLQGYWNFNQPSGNATDSSGNSNTLTNNNTITYVNGHNSLAANLVNASNQFFSILNAAQTGLGITGDMTINMWVKPTGNNTFQYLITKWLNTGNQRGFQFRTDDGVRLQFAWSSDGSGSDTVNSNAAVMTLNVWQMITVVFNSSAKSVQFYVNAVDAGSGTGSNSGIFGNTARFCIGARDDSSSSGEDFDGMIDETSVYNRTLSLSEVQELFRNGSGNYYPFSNSNMFF